MNSPFRDDPTQARARAEEFARELDRQRAELEADPALAVFFPAALRRALHAHSPVVAAELSPDDALELAATLSERADAVARVRASLPPRDQLHTATPDVAPSRAETKLSPELRPIVGGREVLDALRAEPPPVPPFDVPCPSGAEWIDAECTVRFGHAQYWAELRSPQAPLAVLVELWNPVGDHTGYPQSPQVGVAFYVAEGLDGFAVGAEGWLFSSNDYQTGDAAFDPVFRVRGPRRIAAHVLTDPLRAALMDMATYDIPTLRVEGRVASMYYRQPSGDRSIDAALRVAAALRAVPALPPAAPQT